jgi:hypothetical protein
MAINLGFDMETRFNFYYPDPEGGYRLDDGWLEKGLAFFSEGSLIELEGKGELVVRKKTRTDSGKKVTYVYDLYPVGM